VIPIDAIFSPVVKANFLVEKTRVGQDTDWDKLILELWTDRTIKPEDAISEAARIRVSASRWQPSYHWWWRRLVRIGRWVVAQGHAPG